MRTSLLIGDKSPDTLQELDDARIAELSAIEISQMIHDELVRVIRAARLLRFACANDEHMEYYDRSTLERLVYLARRCCRNRTSASRSQRSVMTGGA